MRDHGLSRLGRIRRGLALACAALVLGFTLLVASARPGKSTGTTAPAPTRQRSQTQSQAPVQFAQPRASSLDLGGAFERNGGRRCTRTGNLEPGTADNNAAHLGATPDRRSGGPATPRRLRRVMNEPASASFPALGTTALVLTSDGCALDRAVGLLRGELEAMDLAVSRFETTPNSCP